MPDERSETPFKLRLAYVTYLLHESTHARRPASLRFAHCYHGVRFERFSKALLANLKRDCYSLLSPPILLSKLLYLGLTGAMDVVLLCEFEFSRGDELATEFGRILFINRP